MIGKVNIFQELLIRFLLIMQKYMYKKNEKQFKKNTLNIIYVYAWLYNWL